MKMDARELLEKYEAGERDFSCANLCGAYLGGAYLGGACFIGTHFGGAYLAYAILGDTDLRGAYMRCANLSGADCRRATFFDADITNINSENILADKATKKLFYMAWEKRQKEMSCYTL